MKSHQSIGSYLVVGMAALLLAACSQMKSAQQALDDITNVVQAVPPDVGQYIPEQLASVEQKLAQLNAFYDKKQYTAVLADAPGLLFRAQSLAPAAAAKRGETMKVLEAQWAELSASVPQLVSSVKTRVDAQTKSKRVPKSINLNAAQSELEDATVMWERAQTASKSGNVSGAVSAAEDAKTKAEAVASALKMS
jgi:hypothetical protein